MAGLVALAVFALWWVLLAPVQLGGSTLFSSTVGDSIESRFHKGDLAVIRVASSYRVGDIVLYQSPVLNRPVLHRIIVIQGAHYYFKGDHNTFADPGSSLVASSWASCGFRCRGQGLFSAGSGLPLMRRSWPAWRPSSWFSAAERRRRADVGVAGDDRPDRSHPR